jgi:hypothetical protein
LELAFFQEFSCKEIEAIIGIPEGTVKSRLSYARRALKAILLRFLPLPHAVLLTIIIPMKRASEMKFIVSLDVDRACQILSQNIEHII